MATPRPPKVVLNERERAELERLVRAYTTGQQLALRARMVLLAGDGWNNLQIARELGVETKPQATGDDVGCNLRRCRWKKLARPNAWRMHRNPARRRSSQPSRFARSSL